MIPGGNFRLGAHRPANIYQELVAGVYDGKDAHVALFLPPYDLLTHGVVDHLNGLRKGESWWEYGVVTTGPPPGIAGERHPDARGHHIIGDDYVQCHEIPHEAALERAAAIGSRAQRRRVRAGCWEDLPAP